MGKHVLINGLVLAPPMGGALRYALECLPRAAPLWKEAGGRMSMLLSAQAGLPQEMLDRWRSAGIHLLFDERPMHPAAQRMLRESKALTNALSGLAKAGHPVDLVQTQSLPLPKSALKSSLPLVHLCHGLRSVKTGSRLRRASARAALQHAVAPPNQVIAVSESLAAELRALYQNARVHVARPGAEHILSNREGSSESTTPTPRQNWILCPGPDVPHKNLACLFEALESGPFLPKVHVFGLDRSAKPHKAILERLGTKVEASPPQAGQTLAQALRQCLGVILPSSLESFGLVALEALASGAPLALTNLPAHREVIGPASDQVHWFDPDDPTTCAQALNELRKEADHPDRQTRATARIQRAAEFSWSDCAHQSVRVWSQA